MRRPIEAGIAEGRFAPCGPKLTALLLAGALSGVGAAAAAMAC